MPFPLLAMAIPAIASAIGKIGHGGAKGKEQERMTAADYALQRDRLGLTGYGQYENALQDRAKLDLLQRQFAQDSQKNAFQNALRSSLVGGWAPATRPSGVANISFVGKGFNTPTAQAASSEMDRQSLIKLLDGEKFDALPSLSPYHFSSPEQMPGASTTEKMMGILGLVGTAAGPLLGTLLGGKKPVLSQTDPET